MKTFIHIAVDQFGAECLGRFAEFLEDISEPERERHRFLWAGMAPRPENPSFWDHSFPSWDEAPWGSTLTGGEAAAIEGLDCDRAIHVQGVVNRFQDPSFRRQVMDFLTSTSAAPLTQGGVEPLVITMSGSLADPSGGAGLIGLLESFRVMRASGQEIGEAYIVAGIGQGSGPSALLGKHLTMVGRNLKDLEGWFGEGADSTFRATPVFLVGEKALDGMLSDRPSQVSLGAFALLGLSRSLLHNHQVAAIPTSPFKFRIDDDQRASWAGQSYDPTRPFAVFGAFGIYAPSSGPARLLAARACCEQFELLAKQPAVSTLEACAKVQDLPEDLKSFLQQCEATALETYWTSLHQEGIESWDPGSKAMRTRASWFDLGRIGMLFGSIFKTRDWEQLLDCYAYERMKRLPMDDWSGAINELVEMIEKGYLPRRRLEIQRIEGNILREFVGCVESAAASVFADTFADPIRDRPHRAAQVLLGQIDTHLQEQVHILDREAAVAPPSGFDSVTAVVHKNRLLQALTQIPSPSAILLRLVPVFIVACGLVLGIPEFLGPLDPSPMRLLLGAGVGVIAGILLFERHVRFLKRRLMVLFTSWFEAYKQELLRADDALRRQTFRDTLKGMQDCLQWLFDGTEDEPPGPKNDGLPKTSTPAPPPVLDPDDLRAQTVFSAFNGVLEEAAQGFANLESHTLALAGSAVEIRIPETRDNQVVQQEYDKLVALPLGAAADVRHQLLFASVTRDCQQRRQPYLFPFRASSGEAVWKRGFRLAAGKDLLDPRVRTTNVAFRHQQTLENYIRVQYRGAFRLPARLEPYLQEPHRFHNLLSAFNGLAVPSHDGAFKNSCEFFIAAGPSDPVAGHFRVQNNLGRERLSCRMIVAIGLSADEIIFFPNELQPTRPLGLAWKAYLQHPDRSIALQPISSLRGGA